MGCHCSGFWCPLKGKTTKLLLLLLFSCCCCCCTEWEIKINTRLIWKTLPTNKRMANCRPKKKMRVCVQVNGQMLLNFKFLFSFSHSPTLSPIFWFDFLHKQHTTTYTHTHTPILVWIKKMVILCQPLSIRVNNLLLAICNIIQAKLAQHAYIAAAPHHWSIFIKIWLPVSLFFFYPPRIYFF